MPISSVVLSSQRVALADALYTVKQKLDVDASNPLVVDGQKLIPSVTRVFSRSRDLFVFLQAYERGVDDDAAARRVRDVLSRRREGVRNGAAGVTEGLDARRRRCRFASASRSRRCRPGQYGAR